MADDAIDYMTRMHQTEPDKPIFIKYAPGATHAPHHPTKEWVDKISAMHLFDDGYEQAARAHLREPEAARRDPAGHQADAVAEGRAEAVGSAYARTRRSSSSARSRSSPPTRPTTTTRSGA